MPTLELLGEFTTDEQNLFQQLLCAYNREKNVCVFFGAWAWHVAALLQADGLLSCRFKNHQGRDPCFSCR